MAYAFCHLSVIPCRREAADSSEMVTQMLFGESCEILEKEEKWWKIKTTLDEYECWVDPKQVQEIGAADHKLLNTRSKIFGTTEPVGLLTLPSGDIQTILGGSIVPGTERFELGGGEYVLQSPSRSLKLPTERGQVIEDAFTFMNAPYLWGGKSPFGIDCSGFVQLVFRLNSIFLPRDAYQQAEVGETLSFVEEGQPGDLAYFDNPEGRITHVGILVDSQHIIHASGKVRMDRIDHQGIYVEETKKYTHRLRLLKKVIK